MLKPKGVQVFGRLLTILPASQLGLVGDPQMNIFVPHEFKSQKYTTPMSLGHLTPNLSESSINP